MGVLAYRGGSAQDGRELQMSLHGREGKERFECGAHLQGIALPSRNIHTRSIYILMGTIGMVVGL